MAIRSSVETITPEMAERILTASQEQVKNRKVMDGHVQWLAGQIKAGKWSTNGEAVILDEEGFLLDGQHRLWAVFQSGKEIETVVTRGVPRATFATIDTGAGRSTGNVLMIAGESNCATLSSVLGWLHRYETGRMLSGLKSSGFSQHVSLAVLRKHPEIREIVTWAHGQRANIFLAYIPASVLTFLKYVFLQHKPNKAEEFFELISDVRPDQPGTATRTLRDWFLKDDKSRAPAGTLEKMAVIVKAWSAFLEGEKPRTYVWRRTGAFPESFPTFPGEKESRGKAIRGTVNKEEAAKKRKALIEAR